MKYGGKSNKNFTNILQQNLEVIKILGIQKNIYRLSKLVIFKFTNRVFQFLNIFKKIKINDFLKIRNFKKFSNFIIMFFSCKHNCWTFCI